jgi:hypothetical protein
MISRVSREDHMVGRTLETSATQSSTCRTRIGTMAVQALTMSHSGSIYLGQYQEGKIVAIPM